MQSLTLIESLQRLTQLERLIYIYGKVVSMYLDLIQIEKCDVESIVFAPMAFLAHSKFDIKNLVVQITHV